MKEDRWLFASLVAAFMCTVMLFSCLRAWVQGEIRWYDFTNTLVGRIMLWVLSPLLFILLGKEWREKVEGGSENGVESSEDYKLPVEDLVFGVRDHPLQTRTTSDYNHKLHKKAEEASGSLWGKGIAGGGVGGDKPMARGTGILGAAQGVLNLVLPGPGALAQHAGVHVKIVDDSKEVAAAAAAKSQNPDNLSAEEIAEKQDGEERRLIDRALDKGDMLYGGGKTEESEDEGPIAIDDSESEIAIDDSEVDVVE